ncbi:unnamed protein product (macronuclear) [Paramecium tetraurelia]|uniref:Chromosome undetermined scaffold_1, whole genome shotgun sequence n=1 Tax=Paramecium tetraurelia TaxID=5888 RepID=Q6BFC6_PARTE|nr:hypothetical protein [Paramecium tetraurelia strain d4-2]XP_001422984.1 uncharacterized protein GSPATT00000021001 [Paramecium tetraurelia]CAH03645.1 hypothetical protein PTMB.444c [Paramecium tetraurelia]CAK55586.1 unnamed protein product [Paramecium tetraurelia]|eukprot:XP_001422984.1 hypothetical protein (macronuclear) [Paramecium tetraurelia strain d4-2]
MFTGGAFIQSLHEIKESCPPLQHLNYSHKKSFKQSLDSITQKIPIVKSIHKLRQEQEQKIFQNIQKVRRMNLMHEINKVNPKLHHELKLIPSELLTIKYVEFKQQSQENHIEVQSEISYNKYAQQQQRFEHLGSGYKIFHQKPYIRNIMDDYEEEGSNHSDSYINKYLDLN